MKQLFFLLLIWIFPLFSFSAINECLTDVYFGNGILTDDGNATANTILLKRTIQKDIYNLDYKEYKKYIGKVKEAYNSTHFLGIYDLVESLFQKSSITDFLDDLKKFGNEMKKTAHDTDFFSLPRCPW